MRRVEIGGSLQEVGVADLIQMLATGHKHGRIDIRQRDHRGYVELADGEVVDAAWDDHNGEDAVYALLCLKDGVFGFRPTVTAVLRTVHRSIDALLLEGMRRIDEKVV